ncbi:ACSF2.2 family protein [Megaselia abdita]
MAILRLGRLSKAVRSQLTARCLTTQADLQTQLPDKEVQRGPSYINHIGKDALVYRNVGQHLDLTAENFPNIEAIVSCHENKRLTFSSLVDHVDRLGAGFLKLGLNPGDSVGIWAPNFLHWYLSMLAASRAGLVSVGINPAFQGPEVKYCLNKVGVKAIIAPETFKSQHYYSILESIIPELKNSQPGSIKSNEVPTLKSVIIDTSVKYAGAFRFDDVLDLANSNEIKSLKKNMHKINPDSPCNIQFTSGTTGAPKAAVLSHYNFVNNSIHIGNRNEYKNERICCQVPLFHAYGVVISIMGGISHAATLVLPSAGYNPEASLKAIANEKCTVIHGTPTMYVDLIKKQKELNLPIGTTAKYAVTGGAACSPQLFEDIKNVLGLKKVKTVFGMTETSAVIFQSTTEETKDNVLHTVGHVQDHVEAKVIDANGDTVPFGTPGELCIRGYCNMLGYYGDEEKTKEIMSNDRWLKTG